MQTGPTRLDRALTHQDQHRRSRANVLLGVLLTLVLCLTMFPSGIGQAAPGTGQESSETLAQTSAPLPSGGPVIVGLKRGTVVPARTVAANAGARPTQVYQSVFRGFAANLSATAIRNLARNPNVAFIVADLPIYAAAQSTPINLLRSGVHQSPLAAIDNVDNGVNADIAIIDSGVSVHPDLRVVGGHNCTSSDPYAWGDVGGHGTHVAGTAAAIDNGDGVVGVAPGARIWSVKVLTSSGGSTSNLICGLDWVAANSNIIDVVNMSLEGINTTASTCTSGTDPLHTAVCAVYNRGIPLAVAAGNKNTDAGSTIPAKYPEVITTAAINDYDGRPGAAAAPTCGSQNGPDDFRGYYSNYGSVVDIAAPGSCVTSTTANGGYGLLTGTSMAAPMVSGALALYKSQNPGSSADAARNWVFGSATRRHDSAEGYGGLGLPLLYLGAGQAPSNPPGVANPSFAGSKVPIVYSGDNPYTGSSFASYDNNLDTTWFSGRDYQPRASLTVDLGATYDISGVKWKFHTLGLADQFSVSAVNASGGARGLGIFGNAPYAQTFYGVATTDPVHARYVVFEFTNVSNDASLGSISELEVWARSTVPPPSPSNPPGVANPSFAGSKAPIVYSGDSPYTGSSFASYDNNLDTTWFSGRDYQPRASLTVDLGATYDISGVKWKFHTLGLADQFSVSAVNASGGARGLGIFGNAPYAQTFYGVATTDPVHARYVVFEFTNVSNDASLGSISELEVWARGSVISSTSVSSAAVDPTGTPISTPATPVASPIASPMASPVPVDGDGASDASPAPVTQDVIEGSPEAASPAAVPTDEPPAIPTETAPATPTPTDEPTGTAAPTEAPTATPTATTAPLTEIATGVIVGSDGQNVRCRAEPSTEGAILAELSEGASVSITGDEADGWLPVFCGTEEPGYISVEFVQVGGERSAPEGDATETPESEGELVPTEVALTEAPEETPYPVQRVVDSEESGIAFRAVDDDPQTLWLVDPAVSPNEVWLLMDLGQVEAIDRVTWELGTWNTLPTFEMWLSEDGDTWWNASRIDGWNLEPDVEYEESLGLNARFVMIVVPNVEGTGLAEIGGFREIGIWPAEAGQSLGVLGDPTTPEPPPTEIPTEVPTEAVIPETEEVTDDVPVEETPPAGSLTEPEPGDTTLEPTGPTEPTAVPTP